jgi:HEAT repeat protein
LHSDAEVVKATMLALSDAPDPRVVAHLGACLDHEAWDVRRLAADLLGRVSGEPALALLRARLVGEDSPPVQAAISRALERAAGIRRSLPPGSPRPR